MKILTSFLIIDDFFSYQIYCNTNNTKFIHLFFTKTMLLNKPVDKYI